MNPRMIVGVVALGCGLSAAAQQGIYREPFHGSRQLPVVEAEALPPLELDQAVLTLNPVSGSLRLNVSARRRGSAGPTPDAVVLRLAFASDGSMSSYRLVPDERVGQPLDPSMPPAMWQPLIFHLAPGETLPGLRAISLSTPAAVTIERIADPNGTEIWANPDARELLWRALQESPVGRP